MTERFKPADQSDHPFPGLRPFEQHEAHLFFGREGQSATLVHKLAVTKFLSVLGTSGSGKSSLVRAGLLPALHGGLLAPAGSYWRIALLRPGGTPLRHLAEALAQALGPPVEADEPSLTQIAIIETVLRRSTVGAIEVVKQARPSRHDNLLLLVDQFEELFRFEHSADAHTDYKEEARSFVALLLEAARQRELPIYVCLTMRLEYLGHCAEYPGLPEAINDGQYLIPRLTRDERRLAIEGPILSSGARISRRLVQRLLNDVGDDPDQLPLLQHALNRTWTTWAHKTPELDMANYEAIGGIQQALSRHADEAYTELGSSEDQTIAEIVFKCLTERGPDNLENRRQTTVGRLCKIADTSLPELTHVIDAFRRPDRSFLMPPLPRPLTPDVVIDISHEALMRQWTRLRAWVDAETKSREVYTELLHAAVRHRNGKGSLWRSGPELSHTSAWVRTARPNEHWAELYGGQFGLAMEFLRKSRRKVRRSWATVGAACTIVVLALALQGGRVLIQKQALEEQRKALYEFARTQVYDIPRALWNIPGALGSVRTLLDQSMDRLRRLESVMELSEFLPLKADNVLNKAIIDQRLGNFVALRDELSELLTRASLRSGDLLADLTWREQTATAHHLVGLSDLRLGNLSAAVEHLDLAVNMRETLWKSDASGPRLRDLASSYHDLGNLYIEKGNLAAAMQANQEALTLLEGTPRPAPEIQQLTIWSLISKADILDSQGKRANAEQILDDVGSRLNQLTDPDEVGAVGVERTALSERLGHIALTHGNTERARESFRIAADLATSAFSQEEKEFHQLLNIAVAEFDAGRYYVQTGHAADAATHLHSALQKFRELRQSHAFDVLLERDVADTLIHLGIVRMWQERWTDSHRLFEEALTLAKDVVAQDPNNGRSREVLASAHEQLGELLVKPTPEAHDPHLASEHLLLAVGLREALLIKDPTNATVRHGLSRTKARLADIHRHAQDWQAALNLYRESVSLHETLVDLDPQDVGWTRELGLYRQRAREVERVLRAGMQRDCFPIV
ncbi:hypothetical protein YTPLAS18_17850 [Nitrospira sp.]|nr:hypothetical protein YTPLAS18_17850 [Nitrospira sp.]